MWCHMIKKPISDILETEIKEKCINPMLDCSLCTCFSLRNKEINKTNEIKEFNCYEKTRK